MLESALSRQWLEGRVKDFYRLKRERGYTLYYATLVFSDLAWSGCREGEDRIERGLAVSRGFWQSAFRRYLREGCRGALVDVVLDKMGLQGRLHAHCLVAVPPRSRQRKLQGREFYVAVNEDYREIDRRGLFKGCQVKPWLEDGGTKAVSYNYKSVGSGVLPLSAAFRFGLADTERRERSGEMAIKRSDLAGLEAGIAGVKLGLVVRFSRGLNDEAHALESCRVLYDLLNLYTFSQVDGERVRGLVQLVFRGELSARVLWSVNGGDLKGMQEVVGRVRALNSPFLQGIRQISLEAVVDSKWCSGERLGEGVLGARVFKSARLKSKICRERAAGEADCAVVLSRVLSEVGTAQVKGSLEDRCFSIARRFFEYREGGCQLYLCSSSLRGNAAWRVFLQRSGYGSRGLSGLVLGVDGEEHLLLVAVNWRRVARDNGSISFVEFWKRELGGRAVETEGSQRVVRGMFNAAGATKTWFLIDETGEKVAFDVEFEPCLLKAPAVVSAKKTEAPGPRVLESVVRELPVEEETVAVVERKPRVVVRRERPANSVLEERRKRRLWGR